jgi:hypothetical protein
MDTFTTQLWTLVFIFAVAIVENDVVGNSHQTRVMFGPSQHDEATSEPQSFDDNMHDDVVVVVEDLFANVGMRLRNPTKDVYDSDQRVNDSTKRTSSCEAGRLCAGPGIVYPIGRQVGVVIEGQSVVPPLPKSFDKVETTYYDYLNVFWRKNNLPGYYNQFVPQLMLGNVLANSTNSPDYEPQWLELDSWHIGSQYFMALCRPANETTTTTTVTTEYNCTDWIPKAVTGELIAVEPGEGVYTKFELVKQQQSTSSLLGDNDGNDFEWHLTMGVVGGDKSRVSSIVIKKPFMGMIEPNSHSWTEEIYNDIYVGSCLENYGMVQPENYPSFWRIDVDIHLPLETTEKKKKKNRKKWIRSNRDSGGLDGIQPVWKDWKMDHDQDCDWQPISIVKSSNGNGYQTATWEAWLDHSPNNLNSLILKHYNTSTSTAAAAAAS